MLFLVFAFKSFYLAFLSIIHYSKNFLLINSSYIYSVVMYRVHCVLFTSDSVSLFIKMCDFSLANLRKSRLYRICARKTYLAENL